MRIVSIGGGPAGLYFAALIKAARPSFDVSVYERHKPGDTFGFGVVFSDATLRNLELADPIVYGEIARAFAHWDNIDTHIRGQVVTSRGHGFCGLERRALLTMLTDRCTDLGVELHFETVVQDVGEHEDADLVVAADGVVSAVRDKLAAQFEPTVDMRPNRFVWLGTTFPFEAFTFYFKENEHGLFRVHAYRYSDTGSTFIVECTADAFDRTGLSEDDEDATMAYLSELFADELAGHPLIKNRSIWRRFPTVTNKHWSAGNVVLVGDSAHTAHFSIGSGTKLAMEDGIALRDALLSESTVPQALAAYEAARRPEVERLQRAAQVSLEWFENTERYRRLPAAQFTMSLMMRSLRVSRRNLIERDATFVSEVDTEFAGGREGVAPRDVALTIGSYTVPGRVVAVKGAQHSVDAKAAAELWSLSIDSGQGAQAALDDALGSRASDVDLWLRLEVGGSVTDDDLDSLLAAAAERDVALIELDAQPDARPALVELAGRVRKRWSGPLAVRVRVGDSAAAVDRIAHGLCDAGVDAVSLSAAVDGPSGRLALVPTADRVRNEVGIVTFIDGDIRDVGDVEGVLTAARADLCIVGRGVATD